MSRLSFVVLTFLVCQIAWAGVGLATEWNTVAVAVLVTAVHGPFAVFAGVRAWRDA